MMKTRQEIYQEEERLRIKLELKTIINRKTLTPKEIWDIAPENFYQWRIKHDFPRILKYFSDNLNGFEDWKKESKFSDEEIMFYGISNCINSNPLNEKRKFIVEKSFKNEVTKFISFQNIDNKHYSFGPNPVNHKVISSFIGYIDWCNEKGIKIENDRNDNDFMSRPSTSHPIGMPRETSVTILGKLELLKVGDTVVTPNIFGWFNPKYFEFVNANYLTLTGKLLNNQTLTFENSVVDNLTCEDLQLYLVNFNNCRISNLDIKNSYIQQWDFKFSKVVGKSFNSDLRIISVYGGIFNVDFKSCTFDNVNARQSSINDLGYENTYRTFKTFYASQGDDKKAIEYFLLEKSMERQRLRKEVFSYRRPGLFVESRWEKFTGKFIHIITRLVKYISLSINNFYWGYGRKPFRVLRSSILIILTFSIIYFFSQSNINMPKTDTYMSFSDCVYFSTVTFTTLGYGDFSPLGFLRIITSFEAFLGGISLGFMVAGFSNFKY